MTAPRPPDVLQSSPHHSVRMPPQLDVLTNNSTIRDKIGRVFPNPMVASNGYLPLTCHSPSLR